MLRSLVGSEMCIRDRQHYSAQKDSIPIGLEDSLDHVPVTGILSMDGSIKRYRVNWALAQMMSVNPTKRKPYVRDKHEFVIKLRTASPSCLAGTVLDKSLPYTISLRQSSAASHIVLGAAGHESKLRNSKTLIHFSIICSAAGVCLLYTSPSPRDS